MKISVKKQRLFLAHNWTIARGSSDYKDNVFLTIEKDNIVGYGEAAPNSRYNESPDKTIASINSVIDFLKEADFKDYQGIKLHLDKIINDQNCARAAIDMAILDWIGKSKKMPLYNYFGLKPENIPLTSYSIGIDTITNMQKKVEEFAHMPIFKIKLGTNKDREIISAIREVTNNPIRVDINEAWKLKEKALEQIEWLAGKNIEFVEQPMPSKMAEESFWLSERSPLPIIADESAVSNKDIPLIKGVFDGINIKLMKAGGILESLEMIKTAKSFDMKIMLGCMIETSIAISAAAHIAPLADYIDLDGSLLLANDPYKGIEIINGRIIHSDLPGLGVSEKNINK